jgi:hypothetical protein
MYPLRAGSSTARGPVELGWSIRSSIRVKMVGPASDRRHALQQTIRVPTEVGDQLRLLATLTGTDEEEHLRRAVLVYLETSGRESEVAAFTGRARERLRAVLDRLGDL